MRARHDHWVTVQETAVAMDSTSAEICRLLSIGRLTGIKRKQPGRPGKAQWLVDPKSITKEKHRSAKLAAMARRRK
jgi:hypothetical protein